MSQNYCTKCGTALSDLGKCPDCDNVSDINTSLEEPSAQKSGGNTSSSCCGYGCLIPIILVILMVTCGKSPRSDPPSSQQSTRPKVSEPSSVQQSPPEPEPPRTVQVRPSATHTNDPVCRACGMNHNYVAQPQRSPFRGSAESSSHQSVSSSSSSGTSDLWTTMKAREELELAKMEIKGIYDSLGPSAAELPYSEFKDRARKHGWTVEGGDTFGSWSDFEPFYK